MEGIPLAEVVARLKPTREATGVLVSGYDHIGQNSQRSIVGASWVYPLATLDQLGAFLAVKMNGVGVPADHGQPVRLVVPGWYGCTWINTHFVLVSEMPHGGLKRSGYGKDLSMYALEDYSVVRHVMAKL